MIMIIKSGDGGGGAKSPVFVCGRYFLLKALTVLSQNKRS